jgi:hypothetical protein
MKKMGALSTVWTLGWLEELGKVKMKRTTNE